MLPTLPDPMTTVCDCEADFNFFLRAIRLPSCVVVPPRPSEVEIHQRHDGPPSDFQIPRMFLVICVTPLGMDSGAARFSHPRSATKRSATTARRISGASCLP